VCGECGENFHGESDVKCHMFDKHMREYESLAPRHLQFLC